MSGTALHLTASSRPVQTNLGPHRHRPRPVPLQPPARHRGRAQSEPEGSSYVGTVRITDANRLSTVKPDLAATLNVERSGVTPDSLTVASNRKVYWNCPDFPAHDPWEAVVNNRSGGFRKRYGTGCPTCRLRQTSAQELRLKAELSTVLAIDAYRDAVRRAGRHGDRRRRSAHGPRVRRLLLPRERAVGQEGQ
ncbi:zinc-ribbon domain-containing protein [Streptomyces sp. NBC_01257]|uniref:zinc-ribbon domain-containing protein n=1 Tax=Streptomyces sp. NBC_01257 TaxID=2903799 RepID=UPI003FA34F69